MREQILEWGRDNLTTARAGYTDALQTLKAAFPAIVCCAAFETGGCSHGKPCGCGLTQAPWPWMVPGPCGAFTVNATLEAEARRAWMKPARITYWE